MDAPLERQPGLILIPWVYQWDERYSCNTVLTGNTLALTRSTFCGAIILQRILMQAL